MAPAIIPPTPRKGRWFGKNSSCSGAQSRSTSAGSVPSDAQGLADSRKSLLSSDDLLRKSSLSSQVTCQEESCDFPLPKQQTQTYPNKPSGLPEYDYPTSWSIERQAATFPAPLVIKNTFMSFDIGRPASLNDFLGERQTKSCPTSGIGVPDSTGAIAVDSGDVAGESSVACENPEQFQTPELPVAEALALPMGNFTPLGMLDSTSMNLETPRFLPPPPPQQPPAFDASWSSPMSPAQQQAPNFDMEWASPAAPAPFHVPHVHDIYREGHLDPVDSRASMFETVFQPPIPVSQPHAAPQPIVLDLVQALPSAPQTQRQMEMPVQPGVCNEQVFAPGFSLPPKLGADRRSTPGSNLGLPECPTVGSKGHWTGTCKPCAFFHTKGCGNGTLCVFCHLCDSGEKKRRAKEKRLERRTRYS